MKIIKAGYQILNPAMDDPKVAMDIYKSIERAGRTCYKSEDRITEESATRFVKNVVRNGHEAMLEHANMAVRFTVDRGVSHEFVRHRMASFAQESTRYCNYSGDKFGNEITVIDPWFYRDIPEEAKAEVRKFLSGGMEGVASLAGGKTKDQLNELFRYAEWYVMCIHAERSYLKMLEYGATPEEARMVLPTDLKTEIVVTANMREWRHMFKLRALGTTGKPHPQMAEVMVPLMNECILKMPALFGDLAMEGGKV